MELNETLDLKFLKLIYRLNESVFYTYSNEMVDVVNSGLMYFHDNFILFPMISLVSSKTVRDYVLIYTPNVDEKQKDIIRLFYFDFQRLINTQYNNWLEHKVGVKFNDTLDPSEWNLCVKQSDELVQFIEYLVSNKYQELMTDYIDTYNYLQVYSLKKDEVYQYYGMNEDEPKKVFLSKYMIKDYIKSFEVSSIFVVDNSKVITDVLLDENEDELFILSLIQSDYNTFVERYVKKVEGRKVNGIDTNQIVELKVQNQKGEDILVMGLQRLFYVMGLFDLIN